MCQYLKQCSIIMVVLSFFFTFNPKEAVAILVQQNPIGFSNIKKEPHLINDRKNTFTKGVLDRIEDNGQAIILLEDWEEEIVIAKEYLPKDSRVGTWFTVVFHQERVFLSINSTYTKQQNDKSRALMEQLRTRLHEE